MRRTRNQATVLDLPTLRLEGALLLPDFLQKAAHGQLSHQTEADYFLPKGLKFLDVISQSFQIAQAQWKHFTTQIERQDVNPIESTTAFAQELLRDAFGYFGLAESAMVSLGDRQFPVNLMVNKIPIIIAPHTLKLDEPDAQFAVIGSGSRKKSAFQLCQELLNASEDHLWGMVSNGHQLWLLRDSASITRPNYLAIDFQDLLGESRFAEFGNVWRLIHASRAGISPGGVKGPLVWENWRSAGLEEGSRVREGLRTGVTQALLTLGEGFLQHPANLGLREALESGTCSKDAYFQELLRLVYRFIFLFTVEDRGLIHPRETDSRLLPAKKAYAEGYAMARLREFCLKRRARNRFDDQWQAVRIVFKGLEHGQPQLALPALGGLFAQNQCPHLDEASLDNNHLLTAIRHLRWAKQNNSLVPVDYRNMGPEELGSVYESLLELCPDINVLTRTFGFVGLTSEGSTAGNARKLSGSYYTPDSLVQELIKSALDPVIRNKLQENPANPVEALLSIRVIDPACGSGHFLLAAARRLAEHLAQLRAPEGAVKDADYRHALREVISHSIFGVDRNPMALELARTALWLEGFEEGKPLSFLDHHLQCGDALLGLLDLKTLHFGIPKEAYKPLSGDDKEVCKRLAKLNVNGLKDWDWQLQSGQDTLPFDQKSGLQALINLEQMSEESPGEIAAKQAAYNVFLSQMQESASALAANVVLAAFLLPKTEAYEKSIPTTSSLSLAVQGGSLPEFVLQAVHQACHEARVLHWPLAFPQVFVDGGFDCVLGNPPWEVSQLGEEEFFSQRDPEIASLSGEKRKKGIKNLEESNPRLWREYKYESHRTASVNNFYRLSGRFPLTAFGKLNTYPLFAETMSQITAQTGRAGFIVPTGIATDDSTKAFFGHITQTGKLVSLYDLENRDAVFPSVHRSYKFCLLTLGRARVAEFVCFATQVDQLYDARRHFSLSPEDFRLINPNTLTCPVFRSERDAELTKKLYRAAPVLIEEENPDGNPWGICFSQGLFNMTSDSHLFRDEDGEARVPLYEAKMIHQFDHRWATYNPDKSTREVSDEEKGDPNFAVTPRYWVDAAEVEDRLEKKQWNRGWLMGWRDICRATDERTVIASVLPRFSCGDTLLLMFPDYNLHGPLVACLLADQCSLVHDYSARQKVGGTHLKYHVKKQIPILPPIRYSNNDQAFIISRVLELTYTGNNLTYWAEDLGYRGQPFNFDPDRRAILRAELDAYYARLYGLSRDELRYILDPADVMGPDYPSETFRVLKNNEMRQFGEYRTQRLVLEAWDKMEAGDHSC